MFQEVAQGFSDTGSRAPGNRDPEFLQQLLAIKTLVQPQCGVGSGQQGCGNRCFRTSLFDLQHEMVMPDCCSQHFAPKRSIFGALQSSQPV